MTKVAVEVWDMGSDAGYKVSSGEQVVRLVPVEAIKGAACESSEALFDVAVNFPIVSQDEFSEQEPLRWRSGALIYEGITGTYGVPTGCVAVQVTHEDICTDNRPYYGAKILNEKSLLTMYRSRAQRYDALASEIEVNA